MGNKKARTSQLRHFLYFIWNAIRFPNRAQAWGETEDDDLLKDTKMIRRLKELNAFSEKEKDLVLFTLDAMIREIKNRKEYAA